VFRFEAGVKDVAGFAGGPAGAILDTGFETEKDAAIGSTALTARLPYLFRQRPGAAVPPPRCVNPIG
jgi:hypothetical protein